MLPAKYRSLKNGLNGSQDIVVFFRVQFPPCHKYQVITQRIPSENFHYAASHLALKSVSSDCIRQLFTDGDSHSKIIFVVPAIKKRKTVE